MIVSSNTLLKKPKIYINFLKKNGYIVVKNILERSDFKNLENSVTTNAIKYIKKKIKINSLDNLIFNNELIKLRKKNKKKFAHFYDTLQNSAALYQLWTNNKILKIIEKLMECKSTLICAADFQLRMDSPIDARNTLKWHQDSAYFKQNNSGYNALSCWAPLINLTYNMGPLEFLEKSHKLGCLKSTNKRHDTAKILSPYTGKFETEQRELPKKITQEFKLKKFELELGDMLFLNFDTIHRSGINCSKIFRMSTLCRYHKMTSNDFNPGLTLYRYSDKKLNKEVHGF